MIRVWQDGVIVCKRLDDGEPVMTGDVVVDDGHVGPQRGNGGQHRLAAVQFGHDLDVALL